MGGVGVGLAAVRRHEAGDVLGDDPADHRAHDVERLVARQTHHGAMEAALGPGQLLRAGEGVGLLLQRLAQRLQHRRIATAPCQQGGEGRLEADARLVHVGQGGPLGLEHEPGVASHRGLGGSPDPGAPSGATAHHQQSLGLEDPERLAHRGAGHPELLHELALGRQGGALGELAPQDAAPKALGHQLRSLRDANRIRGRVGDHRQIIELKMPEAVR